MKRPLLTILLCLLLTPLAQAFPPAPYYTLYGLVRDQVGQAVTADGAVLVLLKDAVEIGRTPIIDELGIDHNYELKLRMDANRANTMLYSETAVPANGQFSLVVEMNGSLFYPIEVSGTLTAGLGGERVQLDLTLGMDTDGDGLPDTWEEWQLYQAGYFPDESGLWPINLIDRNGDFDKDGQSNFLEYIAGTFAGDATERFDLKMQEKSDTRVRLEFYAITGKTYTIERSTDMQTWTRIPFSIGAPGPGEESYRANTVSILNAYATPIGTGTKEFYQLTVR